MKFKRLLIDRTNGVFQNVSYLPDVVNLANAFKTKLFDDFFIKNGSHMTSAIIDLIEEVSPLFWVATTNKGEMMAFVYLYDIDSGGCASVTTCFYPKFWGKPATAAAKKFLKYIFYKYKIRKLKAEIYQTNNYTAGYLKKLGFKHEYTAKKDVIVDDKPIDIKVYSLFKD